MLIEKICKYCHKEFQAEHWRKVAKFCSTTCYHRSKTGWSQKYGRSVCEKSHCIGTVHARKMCKRHYENWQTQNYNHRHPGNAMKWYWKNRDRLLLERRTSTKNRDYQRDLRARYKLDVLSYYTTDINGKPVCGKCGFDDIRALCLDHINNDGQEHREMMSGKKHGRGSSGNAAYRWIKKNNYPNGFQVLCANCNMIKEAEYREANPLRNVKKK